MQRTPMTAQSTLPDRPSRPELDREPSVNTVPTWTAEPPLPAPAAETATMGSYEFYSELGSALHIHTELPRLS